MEAYSVFGSRSYRLLFAGSVLSVLGQQMLSIAVSWDLYIATRSPLVLGNVGLVQVIPVLLFSLGAGQVADRRDRRRIVVFTQSLLVFTGFVLAFSGARRGVALIYGCLFLVGTARAFQFPATSALLPQVVRPEQLSTAVSWASSGREIATVVGPALAGFVLAWLGSGAVYLVQAACSVLTLTCFAAMRVPCRPAPVIGPASASRNIGEGLRFVYRNKLIFAALTLDLLGVLFGGATALLPIYADAILHIGVAGLGWLRAAPSVGAALMALLLAHRKRIHWPGITLLAAVAGFGLATIGFAVSTSVVLSFALLAATGAFDNVSVVLRSYLVQSRTPDHLRGRVSAVNSIFISSSNQWGAVESGLAAAWLGTVRSVVWGGIATLVVTAVVAATARDLRDWRE